MVGLAGNHNIKCPLKGNGRPHVRKHLSLIPPPALNMREKVPHRRSPL